MAKRMLESINDFMRVENGYASIENVNTHSLTDHMPSYFLAETCKYLYLIFDPDHFLHSKNIIFTTEGHIFPVEYETQSFFSKIPDESVYQDSLKSCKNVEWASISLDVYMRNGGNTKDHIDCIIQPDRKVRAALIKFLFLIIF
jgi:hypothetical protein